MTEYIKNDLLVEINTDWRQYSLSSFDILYIRALIVPSKNYFTFFPTYLDSISLCLFRATTQISFNIIENSKYKMRIKTIRTEKLFGVFNHVINLNLDDRITIIHGPNGYGKTAILRLIMDIFEWRHTAVRQLHFEKIVLEFDDNTILTVEKIRPTNIEKDKDKDKIVAYNYPPYEPFYYSTVSPEIEEFMMRVDRIVPEISRVSYDEWSNDHTGEILSIEDIIDRYKDIIPNRYLSEQLPEWLKSLQESLDVHFIRATRLESSNAKFKGRRRRVRGANSVVAEYSDELSGHIQTVLADYAELSQSLDRSFPRRLVTTTADSALSMEEIQRLLAELEEKRKRLTDAGLLDKEAETHFDVSVIDDTKAEALSLYISDVKKKLSVFDTLYDRIDLFKSILNRRFSFKTISMDKNNGIEFRTEHGSILSPDFLSSGEQHEVVLLYQLLFKVKTNSLILIDEPELSLHIAWQEQFLNDLEQITTLSSFDVLIATHSPQIISDRWDLTSELKGPDGCNDI